MDDEAAVIVDPEVLLATDSVEDKRAEVADDHEKEIVLDSDDDLTQVGGRKSLDCVTNGDISNSCLKIRKPQRGGYLWRNSQKVSRQSACPPNPGTCKIQFSSTDNKDAQAENKSMIGFGKQVVNQENSRQEQSKELSNHMEEIGMKNLVTELSTRDESDCCTISFSNSETTDRGKDIPLVTSVHELVRLSYIDSQEPEEISLSEPLSFVDHYLSLNTLHFDSEEGPDRNSKQTVCPPIRNTNGLQCLARRANNKRAEESGTFDWDAQLEKKEESFSLKDGCQLSHECYKSETATIDQDADGSNYPKCLDICPDKNFPGHVVSVVRQGLTGDIVKVLLVPELNLNADCAKEVVGHVKIISPDVSLAKNENEYNGEDFSTGVGFDTQVAAEAMEALLHTPPNSNVCYTQKIPSGIIDQSSEDAAILKITGNSTSTATGQRINSKRSARKNYENNGFLSGECDQYLRGHPCSSAPTKKLNENGSSISTILVDEKIQVHGTSFRNKAQQRKRSPENIHGRSSKSSRSNLHGLSEGNTQSSSIIPKRRRSQLLQCSLQHFPCPAEQSKDTSDHGMDFNFSNKRSKRNDSFTDVQGKRNSKENYPELASHASLGDADSRRVIKLKCWSHLKKKRTRVNLLPPHSDEPKHQDPINIFYKRRKLSPSENRNSVQRLAGNLIVYTRRTKYNSVNKAPWTIVKHDNSEKSSYLHTSESSQGNGCNVLANLGKEDCLEQTITFDNVINTVHNSESVKFDEECKLTSSGLNICSKWDERKSKQKQKSISPIIRELRLLGSNKSHPDFRPRDSRRRNSSAIVSVLFSQNLCHKTLRQLKKVLSRLGFSEVSCCSAATHFIADKFVRTKNMLEAIAFGKLVVTPSWLESCGQAGYLIAERNYILRDARKEKELGFSMPVSLVRASQHPLLLGQRVLITSNVKPNKDLIQTLVKAVHGQEVEDFELAETKYGTLFPDLLVLSCEEDYGDCKPFLERGVAIYSSELLLNGIIIQKLQYEKYRILMNYAKRNQSTTRCGRKKGGLKDAEKSRYRKPGCKRS